VASSGFVSSLMMLGSVFGFFVDRMNQKWWEETSAPSSVLAWVPENLFRASPSASYLVVALKPRWQDRVPASANVPASRQPGVRQHQEAEPGDILHGFLVGDARPQA
jgi:hypothetical protein